MLKGEGGKGVWTGFLVGRVREEKQWAWNYVVSREHCKKREGMKPCRTAGGQSLKATSDLDSLWQEALKSRLHGLQRGRQGWGCSLGSRSCGWGTKQHVALGLPGAGPCETILAAGLCQGTSWCLAWILLFLARGSSNSQPPLSFASLYSAFSFICVCSCYFICDTGLIWDLQPLLFPPYSYSYLYLFW